MKRKFAKFYPILALIAVVALVACFTRALGWYRYKKSRGEEVPGVLFLFLDNVRMMLFVFKGTTFDVY